MRRFWFAFYNAIVVPLLWVAIYAAALFKRKIRRGIRGRRNLFPALRAQLRPFASEPKRIWFHSSSLGEFEQAKPIIAELKRRRPDVVVLVSFFSPSGYDHSKNYKLADVITYIPFDAYRNAHAFVDLLRPSAAVIVRYDVWPNHVRALKSAGVPMFLANATMRTSSPRHLPVAHGFHRTVYNELDYILTVSENDVAAFHKFQLDHPVLASIGDTRFDQVWQRSSEARTRHLLPRQLLDGRKIIVVGSTWDSDEEALVPALTKITREDRSLLTILVPHEPTLENIERIERALGGNLTSIRLSDLHDYAQQDVIIIDGVGILMALYQYAHIAYVGGSFRQGIHNVLEPAVYGAPILFGPVHANSQEAVELARQGGAFIAHDGDELYGHFRELLTNESARRRSGEIAKNFVERNTGATGRFLSYLEKVL